jgi:hypothetical protein
MFLVGQSDGFLGTQQSTVFNDSMSTYDYCKRFYLVPGTHTSFLNVNDPIFNSILDFADSLWADQLCPSAVGIAENKKNNSGFELYPNPAREKISLKGIDLNIPFEVYVFDALGKMQFYSSVETEFNLTGLAAGLYFFRVKQKNSDIYSKFIKE